MVLPATMANDSMLLVPTPTIFVQSAVSSVNIRYANQMATASAQNKRLPSASRMMR